MLPIYITTNVMVPNLPDCVDCIEELGQLSRKSTPTRSTSHKINSHEINFPRDQLFSIGMYIIAGYKFRKFRITPQAASKDTRL